MQAFKKIISIILLLVALVLLPTGVAAILGDLILIALILGMVFLVWEILKKPWNRPNELKGIKLLASIFLFAGLFALGVYTIFLTMEKPLFAIHGGAIKVPPHHNVVMIVFLCFFSLFSFVFALRLVFDYWKLLKKG